MLLSRSAGVHWPLTSVEIWYGQNCRGGMLKSAPTRPWTFLRHFDDTSHQYYRAVRIFEHYFHRPGIASTFSNATSRQYSRRETQLFVIGQFHHRSVKMQIPTRAERSQWKCTTGIYNLMYCQTHQQGPSQKVCEAKVWMQVPWRHAGAALAYSANIQSPTISRRVEKRKPKMHKASNLGWNYY